MSGGHQRTADEGRRPDEGVQRTAEIVGQSGGTPGGASHAFKRAGRI